MVDNDNATFVKGDTIAFRHGFFTRNGGFSKKPHDSLNVTTRVGDSEANVKANRAKAIKSLQLHPERLAFLDELGHKSKILHVTEAAAGKDFNGYDVIMTNDTTVSIGLSVADCVPVIVASEEKGAIMIIHAGWRGLEDYVIEKAILGMRETFDVDPAELKAVIGPHISVESYEFKTASDIFSKRYVQEFGGIEHLDLTLMTTDQLTESGVDVIENLGINTFTDQRFSSVRRDGPNIGRCLILASL